MWFDPLHETQMRVERIEREQFFVCLALLSAIGVLGLLILVLL